jgi:hypothetical protein
MLFWFIDVLLAVQQKLFAVFRNSLVFAEEDTSCGSESAAACHLGGLYAGLPPEEPYQLLWAI